MGRGRKIAEAFVEIGGDKGAFSKTIRGAKLETAGFAKSATRNLKKIGIGLAAIGIAAGIAAVAIGVKLTKAIIRAGAAVVKTSIQYDKLKIGLIAVTGSGKEAERQIRRLRVLSQDPGLGFKQALQGSINLQAAGLSAALAERSLSAFGNALAVVGKGADDLDGVSLALTQIANKTSGFGQDIRQLQERLPQMQTALKNAFDGKPIEDLNITGKELIAALVTEFEKLGKAGESAGNNINNLKTSFDLLKKSLGDALLGQTSTVVKSLTSIIDKVTLVVQHYKDFRDEAATVFRQIATIGIKLTTELTIGMAKILIKASKIIWVPLKFEIIRTMQDVNDAVEIGMIKMMGKVREFFGGSAEIAKLQEQTVKRSRVVWDSLFNQIRNADFDKAIRENMAGIEKDLTAAFNSITTAIKQADAALDPLVAKFPKIGAVAADAEKTAGAIKKVGGVSKEVAAIFADLGKEIDAFFGKRLDDNVDKTVAGLNKILETQEALAEATKKALEDQQRTAQNVADAIRPVFENMFTSFFSGNTKSLWQKFWADLKNIAIRQMAAIFATQLVAGLLTGGTSLAATGGASLLGALAPSSIDPTSRAIGGGVARAAGAIGSFLEGGTIIIQDQDLDNFDVQRLTKQVEQGIAPALAEAAADGI